MELLDEESRKNDRHSTPNGFRSLKQRHKHKDRRCCCVFGSIFLVLVFLAAVIILIVLFLMIGTRPPRVQTNCGIIQGNFDTKTTVFIFKGIPYASPPTGKLRWMAPMPLDNNTCWSDVLLADRMPDSCAQMSRKGVIGIEDCLYLNIYSPAIDPLEPVPVMVYIHGGYLQWGNMSVDGYYPDERAAEKMGFVFVNIQYRLNAFGFMVNDALPKEEGHSGNYGLLDQIEALKWIKANIRNFGGDPKKITVYGQSSGGTSVFMLLSSPKAVGLFQRAWIISGSPILNKTYADAVKQNQFFLDKTGCKNKSCVMNLSTEKVLVSIYPEWEVVENSMDLPNKNVFEPALPIVDGDIIPEAPFDMWDNKRSDLPDVPVVVGTTAQEIDLNPTPGVEIEDWTMDNLHSYVHEKLSTFDASLTNASLDLYKTNLKTPYLAEYIFTTMVTDLRITCGNDIMTEKMSKGLKSDVYRYVVTSFPSYPVRGFGNDFKAKFAFHGWDTYAFFDTFYCIMGPGNSERDFQYQLRSNIMNFVESGVPKDHEWKPYKYNITALIGRDLKTNVTYNKAQCNFWMNNGFFPYSWIN